MTFRKGLALLLLALGSMAAAQTTVTFWHSMGGAEEAVNELAATFNAAQSEYRVDAQYVGGYPEAQTRLVAAFGTSAAPVLFQAEVGYWPRLVFDGALQDLSEEVAGLDEEFIADFYPGLWAYGELNGGRYGLPWNSSTPVMYYNADALERAGLTPPATWDEFAAAARQLTSRQGQGAAFVGDSWLFEMIVLSMGGELVLGDGTPNFESEEALAALTMLSELVRDGSMAYYSTTERTAAILTFVRTRAMMTFASIANWPDVRRFSIGFTIAAHPVPSIPGASVPLGGAQLAVLNSATDEERAGAFAFWQFLMEPENLAFWIRDSYYIPVRRSALPLLEEFYAEDPNRGAAREQLELAVPRPRVADFNSWRGVLDEMLDRALRGGAAPAEALSEAQRRAVEGF